MLLLCFFLQLILLQNSAKENYIQQLALSNEYIQNSNLLFFGHCGAGKSSIIRLMKLGLFSMLLDKSRNTLRTINNNRKCIFWCLFSFCKNLCWGNLKNRYYCITRTVQ